MDEGRQVASEPTPAEGGCLSEVERVRRQRAVETAYASMRLSGHELSPEFVALNQRYIDGEITSEQLTAEVKRMAG